MWLLENLTIDVWLPLYFTKVGWSKLSVAFLLYGRLDLSVYFAIFDLFEIPASTSCSAHSVSDPWPESCHSTLGICEFSFRTPLVRAAIFCGWSPRLRSRAWGPRSLETSLGPVPVCKTQQSLWLHGAGGCWAKHTFCIPGACCPPPPPTSALGFLHSVMASNGENTGVKVRGSHPGSTLLAMLVSWSLCASVSSSVKWG